MNKIASEAKVTGIIVIGDDISGCEEGWGREGEGRKPLNLSENITSVRMALRQEKFNLWRSLTWQSIVEETPIR